MSTTTQKKPCLSRQDCLARIAELETAAGIPDRESALAAAKGASAQLESQRQTIATQKQTLATLSERIDNLTDQLKRLKASKAPASAIARAAETATRKTANDLAAARREAAPARPASMTAADYIASKARPTMARSEWQKLSDSDKSAWIREGGKLSD